MESDHQPSDGCEEAVAALVAFTRAAAEVVDSIISYDVADARKGLKRAAVLCEQASHAQSQAELSDSLQELAAHSRSMARTLRVHADDTGAITPVVAERWQDMMRRRAPTYKKQQRHAVAVLTRELVTQQQALDWDHLAADSAARQKLVRDLCAQMERSFGGVLAHIYGNDAQVRKARVSSCIAAELRDSFDLG